jgi:cullin 2
MLQVHLKYENLISETFKNDSQFLGALDKACSSVINSKLSDGKTLCRSAELVSFFITFEMIEYIVFAFFNEYSNLLNNLKVAKYCDNLLKKSKSTECEIETKLTRSITIFKYIEDKDIYQKFYSRMLAKRYQIFVIIILVVVC